MVYIYVAYTLRKRLFKSVYLYYVAHLVFIDMFCVLAQKRDELWYPSMKGSTENKLHSGSVLIMRFKPDKSGNEIS